MEIIESLNNNKIKELAKLKNKKYRDDLSLFLIEGEHLIEEAYKTNQLVEIIALPSYTTSMDVPITYVKDMVLKKISDLEQNIKCIGVCKKFKPLSYGKRLILLDNIQDPGNLGTIIRSAVSFNIDTVIVSDNSCDIYNPKAIRATEGMIFHLDTMVCDLADLINGLKANGYKIYGTDVINGINVCDIPKTDKIAFVIGNEGQGVSNDIKSRVDQNIYIPINKKCESLNASVAASIIMYEISKVDYE